MEKMPKDIKSANKPPEAEFQEFTEKEVDQALADAAGSREATKTVELPPEVVAAAETRPASPAAIVRSVEEPAAENTAPQAEQPLTHGKSHFTWSEKIADKAKEVAAGFGDRAGKIFAGLRDEAKYYTVELYERATLGLVDRAKIAWNNKLLDWHDGRSKKWEGKLADCNGEIDSINKLLKQYGSDPKLERRLNDLATTRDKFKTQIEYRNSKKTAYENTKKDIANGTIENIDKLLSPHENRLEKLQGTKGQLDAEILKHGEAKKKWEGEIAALEEQLENTPYKAARGKLKEKIKELKTSAKAADKLIRPRLKERQRLEHRLTKVNYRANIWRDKRNGFARVTQEGSRQVELTPKERARETTARGEVAVTGRYTERAAAISMEDIGTREGAPLSPETFTTEWNGYFGSEMEIDLKDLLNVEIDGKTLTADEATNFEKLASFAAAYYNEHGDKRRLSAKQLAKNLETLQKYLELNQ